MSHPADHLEPLPDRGGTGESRWRRRRTLNPRRYDYTTLAGFGVLIGAWSFLAPWMLGYFHHRSAWIGGFILGAVLILGCVVTMGGASGTSTVVHPRWLERWALVAVALGCWSIAEPWVLGYSGHTGGVWSSVICGVALVLAGAGMDRAARGMAAEGARGGVPDPEAHVLDAEW
jgi:MFS family permease